MFCLEFCQRLNYVKLFTCKVRWLISYYVLGMHVRTPDFTLQYMLCTLYMKITGKKRKFIDKFRQKFIKKIRQKIRQKISQKIHQNFCQKIHQ